MRRFTMWFAVLGAISCAHGATYKVAGPYLGCWRDAVNRVLPTAVSAPDMTIGKCVAACQDKGFPYAGLEYGSQCFCGNDYRRIEQLSESSCNMPCAGDKEKMCGGFWASSVYGTGVNP